MKVLRALVVIVFAISGWRAFAQANVAPTNDLPGVPMLADLVGDARAKALVALLDSSSILGRSIAALRLPPTSRSSSCPKGERGDRRARWTWTRTADPSGWPSAAA